MKPLPDSIYTDGGTVGSNPSKLGGSWAFVWVDKHDKLLTAKSGIVTPKQARIKTITNNFVELLAAVFALESVPDGWAGLILTDSRVTLLRITDSHSFNGIPKWLEDRCRYARKRRNHAVVLLGGHPTKRELADGVRRDGAKVSKFNVLVDKRCKELAAKFRLTRQDNSG